MERRIEAVVETEKGRKEERWGEAGHGHVEREGEGNGARRDGGGRREEEKSKRVKRGQAAPFILSQPHLAIAR
jgi:hypothetical protein